MRKLVTILLTWAATSATADTCVECHAELEDELLAPVHLIDQDAHSRQGLSCADCHGGDPDSDDPDISMDWDAGFVGVPERDEIPALCGRCHSDATFIRQYNPGLRIDQEALYATSYHGQLLMEGDDKVAT